MRLSFFFLILSFFLFSCNENPNHLSFSEEIVSTPSNSLVHITIPKAKGSTQVSEKINSKIESVISQAINIGDPDKKMPPLKAQIDSFNIQFQKFKEDFPDSPMVWEAQVDGEVLYQSIEVITLALTTYTNTGGAHGITTISFWNFDASSGESLENTSLFNDLEDFKTLAKTYFLEEIKGKEADYWNLDDFQLPANIGFSEDGIILLYNVYEIAPYSSGVTEFNIPFEKAESYLNYH